MKIDNSGCSSGLNTLIFPSKQEDVRFVDLSDLPKLDFVQGVECMFCVVSCSARGLWSPSFLLRHVFCCNNSTVSPSFFFSNTCADRDSVASVSHVIIGDLSKKSVRNIILSALQRMEISESLIVTRLAWLDAGYDHFHERIHQIRDSTMISNSLNAVVTSSQNNPKKYFHVLKQVLSLEGS